MRAPEPDGAGGAAPAILLVATADWDAPLWTNKQHVAVELARQGRKVLYVESAGLRRPTLRRRDLTRIWRRLRRALRPPREVRPGLWVCSPPTLPWQGVAAIRRLNRALLGWSLGRAARQAKLRPRVLLTYSPLSAALQDLSGFDVVAYHCVDDVAAQPGMPSTSLRAAEAALVRRADVVFVTAPALEERCRAAGGGDVRRLSNVCDAEHFGRALRPETVVPPDLARIPEPRIGFIGAVSGYKLDLPLLRATALARPGYSFVLIGPVGEGDPWTDPAPLVGLANLHLLGPRPYAQLPAYLRGFDAAMLASAANPYTRAMFPMKFFEYLAAGLPVVSTPLPALAEHLHLAIVAEAGPEGFAAAIDQALAGRGPGLDERLAAASGRTYAWRTGEMLAVIDGLLAPKGIT